MSQKNTAIREADRRGYHCDQDGNIYNQKFEQVQLYPYGRYMAFSIRIGDAVIKVPVHRFVAFQVHGDVVLNEKVVVRHMNNNSLDNSWGNIGFGSQRENMMDRPRPARIAHARHAASFRKSAA